MQSRAAGAKIDASSVSARRSSASSENTLSNVGTTTIRGSNATRIPAAQRGSRLSPHPRPRRSSLGALSAAVRLSAFAPKPVRVRHLTSSAGQVSHPAAKSGDPVGDSGRRPTLSVDSPPRGRLCVRFSGARAVFCRRPSRRRRLDVLDRADAGASTKTPGDLGNHRRATAATAGAGPRC